MIKNLLLISILCFFGFSCLKKFDPEYVEPKQSVKKIILLKSKV